MTAPATPSTFAVPGSNWRGRRPVSLLGKLKAGDGRSVEVLLLDLACDGCGIETPEKLETGEAVTLSIPGRGPIDAIVRWYGDSRAGLLFDLPAASEEPYRRRPEQRVAIEAQVMMRRIGGSKYRVPVYDLSPQGCKIECVERLRIGEHVLIKFEGIEVLNARVCWLENFVAGVNFENPIHPAVLELLLAKSKR